VKATRRTVLGWLLAALIIPPKLELIPDAFASMGWKGTTWSWALLYTDPQGGYLVPVERIGETMRMLNTLEATVLPLPRIKNVEDLVDFFPGKDITITLETNIEREQRLRLEQGDRSVQGTRVYTREK
jgi:hypothetical protein